MLNKGFIEINVTGFKGKSKLSPENYDISEIIEILKSAEKLLFPNETKRPNISYRIEKGSVRHTLTTSLQAIISLNAILGQVKQEQNIHFLEDYSAKGFEDIQNLALKRDYVFNIRTSLDSTNEITIDKYSNFKREQSVWVDAEFYFYGIIKIAGGAIKAKIEVETENYGKVVIQNIPINILKDYPTNLLYKVCGVRAVGKQNLKTGEMNSSNLNFKELIIYDPVYNEEYLEKLREKAAPWLSKIDTDEWLKELREGYAE